ncbi:cupin domain-containing protein [Clostridium grantii]|uniref:Mannose-6-phosphate isomerase, cupin superfamily n=1 Tax=Clostridium grantii DSM 8605 TaxID=1121316 RepID=A0A1M5T017_9CLOT|nr:cupin domain-containing protein [Clostridium grantii]SHH43948.1 Mannose-6-phosphate isomerase, cupin superfamily [Clostridium grantii DSM 8605]
MYNVYNPYASFYYPNVPMCNLYNMYNAYTMYPSPYFGTAPMDNPEFFQFFRNQQAFFNEEMDDNGLIKLKDYGPEPFVFDINEATIRNNTYRTALWTGDHLQVTLMSIPVGEDIGLEIHPTIDQFLRVEEGEGIIKMGNTKNNLCFQKKIVDDSAILIPAGTWHNLINTGDKALKLYSIYAPPQHPFGTVHETKAIAEASEKEDEFLY